MLSLVGDRRDRFGGGGLTTYSVTWSTGSLDLESAQAGSIDAATARTDGHYDKFGLNLMRLQSVTQLLNWFDAGRFVVKASYAHKIGAAIATSAPGKGDCQRPG